MKYTNLDEDSQDTFLVKQIVFNHKKPSEWSLQQSKYSFLQATINKSITNLLQNDDNELNKSLNNMRSLAQRIQKRTQSTSQSLKKILQKHDSVTVKISQKQVCPKSSNLTKRTISTQRSKKCVKYLNLKSMIQQCEQNNKNQFEFERESTIVFDNQENLLKSHFQVDENLNFIKSEFKNIEKITPLQTEDDIWTIQNQTIMQQLDKNFESRMNEVFQKKVLKNKKKVKTENQELNCLSGQQRHIFQNTNFFKKNNTRKNLNEQKQYFIPKGVYEQILSSYSTARLIAMNATK